MEPNSLDIIIVNYNSTDYTIKCMESVYRFADLFKLRIIVVDNCSSDYPDLIKQAYPEVNLVMKKSNMGFSKAVNIALKKATGDIAILLNPDTVVCEGFFAEVVHCLKQNEDAAVIGPKVLDYDGTIQGSARRFPKVLTSIFGRKSPLTRLFPNNPVTKREFVCFHENGGRPIDVDWVSGACMVIRKKALDEVGGFDERFFMYWEDTDLCIAMKDKGWRVIYLPGAQVYHHVGISSDSAPISSLIHFHKSCYLLCKKHAKGIKRAMIPLALFGLGMRCLLVISLNRFLMTLKKAHDNKRKIQFL